MTSSKIRILNKILLILFPAIFAVVLISQDAFAAENDDFEMTEVTRVDRIEDIFSESFTPDKEASFTIDVSEGSATGSLADLETESKVEDILSGNGSSTEKQEGVIDALDESGMYFALEGKGNEVQVTALFALQRLRLDAPYKEDLMAYGASSAVYYDGYYILNYDSEDEAKYAYYALAEEYGPDSVITDIPVEAEASAYIGWGTEDMGLDRDPGIAPSSGKKIRVAVLDTGIDRNHPIFADDTILKGYDFVNKDSDPTDDAGHGTAVSGIIAESTYFDVEILPVKVLDADGRGEYLPLLTAIEYAEKNKADIINLALGNYISKSEMDKYEKRLKNIKALLVCAAGNDSKNLDLMGTNIFPGESSKAVCVSSISKNGSFCSFSNYGSAIDFTAPGKSLYLAANGGRYAIGDGTSFSVPYIVAAAAKVKYENSNAGNDRVLSILRSRAVDLGSKGKDVRFGYGYPCFCNKPPVRTVTIRNTIANSNARTNDVVWDKSQIWGANKFEINWRAPGASKWASRTVGNTVRGTTSGLSIGGLYEIRVRGIRDCLSGKAAYGSWSRYVYRYFHTTERIRLASRKKGSFIISWKKNPKAAGYQIMFSTKSNGAGAANNINTVGANRTSFTKTGLTSGRTYYVQIREIRKSGGKTYYGNISKPVAVRIR